MSAVGAELGAVLRRAVNERGIAGIAIAVGDADRLIYLDAYGHAQTVPRQRPLGLDTVWDLASLTKVIATTTLIGILLQEGRLSLDDPVGEHLQELRNRPAGRPLLRHLLTHTSGLVHWRPYYATCRSSAEVLAAIREESLEAQPGERLRYSDVGFILLGEIAARAAALSLDELFLARVANPLGMPDTTYNPSPGLAARCAATEFDEETGEVLIGTVHDENARAMGGVSGHAGLFSTAYDVARFGRCMLRRGAPLLSEDVFRAIMTREPSAPSGERFVGWDGVTPGGPLDGIFGPRAFGHTGFTGTSLWHDPDEELFITVLTNAVHPTRRDDDAVFLTRVEAYRAAVGLVRAVRDAGV